MVHPPGPPLAGPPLASQDGGQEPQAAVGGISALSARFQASVEDAFERVGVFCAAWPRVAFALCLLACFACSLGTRCARMDGDPYSMFTVYRGQWELGNEYTLAHRGGELGVQPSYEYIMMEPFSSEAVAVDVLDDQLKLLTAISALQVRGPHGQNYTLSDVCENVDVSAAIPDFAPLLDANLTGETGLLSMWAAGGGSSVSLRDELATLAQDGTLKRLADQALRISPLNVSSVDELSSLIIAANLSDLGNPNITETESDALNDRLTRLLLRLGLASEPRELPNDGKTGAHYDPVSGAYVVRVSDDDMERSIGLNGTELNEILMRVKARPSRETGGQPRLRMPKLTAEQARRVRDSTVGAAINGDPYAAAATAAALAELYDLADSIASNEAKAHGLPPPEGNERPDGLPSHYDPAVSELFVYRNGTLNPDFAGHLMRRFRLTPPKELARPPAQPSDAAWEGTLTPERQFGFADSGDAGGLREGNRTAVRNGTLDRDDAERAADLPSRRHPRGPPPSELGTLVDLAFARALLSLNDTAAGLGAEIPLLREALRRSPMPGRPGAPGWGDDAEAAEWAARADEATARFGGVGGGAGGAAAGGSGDGGADGDEALLTPAERVERLGGLAQLVGALFVGREAEALGIGDVDVVALLSGAVARAAVARGGSAADGGRADSGGGGEGGSGGGGGGARTAPLTLSRALQAFIAARRRYGEADGGESGAGGLAAAGAAGAGAEGGGGDAMDPAVRAAREAEASALLEQTEQMLRRAVKSPCIRSTALDCFAEGGFDFPFSPDEWRVLRLIPAVKATLDAAGVDAYTRRPSFRDPSVPLGAAMTGGCPGFAARVPALHWREEALLGAIEHETVDGVPMVSHARAMRATVLLAGDVTIARRLGLSQAEAAKVMGDFRLSLEHLVPAVPLESSRASVFVSDAFLRVIEEHMGSASAAVGAGYVLMVVYVLAVLRTPKLALAGIALLLCDLAGGFGLACLLGVPSSILTLTVLPFVSLGIAVDGLFLILHTFQAARAKALLREAEGEHEGDDGAERGGARVETLIPAVTRAVGPSILFTGCTNGAAYAAASTIPLHAIMNFSRQCGILLFFNAAVTLVGVPALIAITYGSGSASSKGSSGGGKRGSGTASANGGGGGNNNNGDGSRSGGGEGDCKANGGEAGKHAASRALEGGEQPRPPPLDGDGASGSEDDPPTRTAAAPAAASPAHAAFNGAGSHRAKSVGNGCGNGKRATPGSAGVSCPTASCGCGAGDEGIMAACARLLARLVISRAGHVLLLVLFGALTAVAMWAISWMQPGLILSELVPSTDITSTYLTAEGDYFSFFPVTVATKAVDYASPSVQAELLAFRERISLMPEAVQPLPPFWLHYLLAYANATGTLGWDGLVPAELFYPTLESWREADPLSFAQSQGNFGYDAAGRIIYAEMPIFVHGVQEPTACIGFVGSLQSLCDDASVRGLPSYALGLPFYRCERYVHLRFWCVRGVAIALAVVLAVSIVFMGALREALLMAFSLFANLVQLAGLLAFCGMKINGALVMATVASIGCASEYAGHFTMAFLQARGSAAERISFAYERSLHPLFDSACSTVLGVLMIAFAAFPFVVKYFFVPMVILTVLNFLNAVLLLPCLLLLLGHPQPALPLGSDDPAHCDVEKPPPPPLASSLPQPQPVLAPLVAPRTPVALVEREEAAPGAAGTPEPAEPAQPRTPEPESVAGERALGREFVWEPSPAPPPPAPRASGEATPTSAARGKERTVLFSGFDFSDESWGGEQRAQQML